MLRMRTVTPAEARIQKMVAAAAPIARMKDSRTHLAYKHERAVDLDIGAVVAAEMHPAGQGDTALPDAAASAAMHLAAVDAEPTLDEAAELVADKGCHLRKNLKKVEDGPWRSRIAEPRHDGLLRWYGNDARRTAYNSRARLLSEMASSGPSWWSAALPRSWTVAGCERPGCLAARTSTSTT